MNFAIPLQGWDNTSCCVPWCRFSIGVEIDPKNIKGIQKRLNDLRESDSGADHKGPDIVENIMCVCPNHHALLDYGAIPINLKNLRISSGHMFSEQYVEYHNTKLYKQVSGSIMAPSG